MDLLYNIKIEKRVTKMIKKVNNKGMTLVEIVVVLRMLHAHRDERGDVHAELLAVEHDGILLDYAVGFELLDALDNSRDGHVDLRADYRSVFSCVFLETFDYLNIYLVQDIIPCAAVCTA